MDKGKRPTTLLEAVSYFADFENCKDYMVQLRWGKGKVTCPQCGSDDVSYLPNARVFKCFAKPAHSRAKFSLKVGTIFADSPIALEKWLPVVWMLANCKNGVSSWEIHRAIGVTQKSAWFMLHRVRLAMQDESVNKMTGTIEADETFVGGKVRNMHLDRQTRMRMGKRRAGGFEGKVAVMGLLERHGNSTGSRARVKVLPNTRAYHIRTNVIDNVERGANVYTDSLHSYRNLPVDGFVHEFIDHTEAYVRGQVHTNGLENFWSLFKRALKGTYVSVEPFHLQGYADEQAFRFNNRGPMNDSQRFSYLMRKIVGKRITYAELTGKLDGERQEGDPQEV
jgi:transposase-like protein